MNEHENGSLSERVERLEREVGELRTELRHALQSERVPAERRASAPESEPPGTRSASFGTPFDLGNLSSGEWWLNKIGIGLLLFGIAFLFMFSVERGWISPPMRAGFGLAIGAALLTIGLRVYENRRAFSQVLLGGGVGAFYITGFAAFQLYELVPYPAAFAFMAAVTLLAYFLSLRQDQAPLSIIGVLGGLGTPFLLYTDAGSLGGLVLYTCLILAGMAAVYFYKGWVSLLAVSSTGGWLIFFIGYVSSYSSWATPSLENRWTLQLGVAFAWLLFWLVPVAREVLRGSGRGQAHLYTVSTPIVALGFTAAIWTLSSSDFGWITLSGAVLYALATLVLWCFGSRLYYAHTLVALLLMTHTFILKLDGNVLLFTLAAEAAVLHYLARRFSDRIISIAAHLLFFAVTLWLAARLLPGPLDNFLTVHPALFNVRTFVDLAVIILIFAASGFVLPRNLDTAYRIAGHAALLALLWRELSVLPGGDAWVTVAWGLYAVGLLVAGLRLNYASIVRGGMATLFLVVGKLFLVDLAEVEAIWRVLLFLGFGGLFLALSYYLRSLWRPSSEGEASTRAERRATSL